jgi:hypothetical protein
VKVLSLCVCLSVTLPTESCEVEPLVVVRDLGSRQTHLAGLQIVQRAWGGGERGEEGMGIKERRVARREGIQMKAKGL